MYSNCKHEGTATACIVRKLMFCMANPNTQGKLKGVREIPEALSSAKSAHEFCPDAETITSEQSQESNPSTQHAKKQPSFESPATELPTYYKRKRSEPANLVSSD